MSYERHVTEHFRLAILRLLAGAGGSYSANDSILTDALPRLGFAIGRDRLRGELSWLRDSGLVKLDEYEGLMVAALTRRGLDVAHGRTDAPGVKRRGPSD